MVRVSKTVNLVLGGGGVKGIAYAGVFDVAERRGYRWVNLSGVSVGALAGAFTGAGCSSYEMWKAMEQFDFEAVQVSHKVQRLPVVNSYIEFANQYRVSGLQSAREFLNRPVDRNMQSEPECGSGMLEYQRNILSSIISYSKQGCLLDGDYLEEWISKVLARKGVRTFGDLRGGMKDNVNPRGYKLRMTAVDCNRARVVVIPDDVVYYGLDPDEFEVAKAVRMSTCVPFAFKPVELKKKEGNKVKTYNLVDGGVFDKFPFWLIGSSYVPTVGFKLDGGQNKLLSLDTPLNILKALISVVHDIGIPKNAVNNVQCVGKINTGKVASLDFGLSEEQKRYLYNAGRQTAIKVFNNVEYRIMLQRRGILGLIFPMFGR